MTPQQALANLYTASRLLSLSAEQHEILSESHKVLESIISPPEEVKEVAE
jgi:hypothetical protein